MANLSHIAILNKGVSSWNKWRQSNPGVRPDLSETNIRIRKLPKVNFRDVDLHRSLLAGADLRGANLENSDLSGADLMEANLQGAWLGGANLKGANLMGANLSKADLIGADIEEAILYRADLNNSQCARNCLWLKTLMDFANGLISLNNREPGFEFDDAEGAYFDNSFLSTSVSRLEINISDPVSSKAIYEILGALNNLYSMVSNRELPGPIIKIGIPD